MPDSDEPTTPPGDWETSQANARACVTDEYQVRAQLSDGACLSTPYDMAPSRAGSTDVICVEAGADGIRELVCIDYDEFTIAGAALLELRDTILAQRDD